MRGGGNPFSLARKKGFPPPSRSPLPPQNALFSPRQPPDAREYPMSHEQNECHCTPRLRFPEFANSAWYQKKIGDVCRLQAGSFISASSLKKECSNKLYPCYGGNGLRGFVDTFNCDGEFPLIGRQGELCGNVKFVCGRFYATEHAVIVNVAIENCIKFIYYLLIYTNLNRFSVGQAQPGLAVTSLNKIVIVIPQLKEQQKIADCLTSLDDLITAHEQKRDALKQHKKGLMQRLFPAEGETTPRWRFPEFREAGEWEMKKLNDCCRIITGGTPSRKNPSYWNGKIPWISSRHISDIHTVESCEYITEKGIKYSSTKVIPKDSIILVSRVSVGKYAKTVCDTAINQDITALLPYSINCNFLFFYVDIIAKMIKNSAAGTGVVGVSQDFFDNIVINAPTLPEQQKIADCLSSLDERIAAQEAKIAALREHKKGLMQQLFPRAL